MPKIFDARQLPISLTLDQAAMLLQLQRTTVKKMAAAGQIPAYKVGKLWRVDKNLLLAQIKDALPEQYRAAGIQFPA